MSTQQLSQRRRQGRPVRVLGTLVCLLGSFVLIPAAAHAAFPGRNGRIAYATIDEGGTPEFPTISTVRPDGTRRRAFFDATGRPECHAERTPCPAYGPSYSPHGGRLLAAGDFPPSTFYVIPARDGRNARPLRKRRRNVVGRDASWSPDGHAVLYTDSDSGESIRRLRANQTRRLGRGRDAQWSRRGRIAFVRREGPNLEPTIYTMNPKGTGVRRIGPGSGPDWSPQGRWLAFTTRDGRVVMTNGAETRTLVRPYFVPCQPGFAFELNRQCVNFAPCEPAFSPDGRWVVFAAVPLYSDVNGQVSNPCAEGVRGLSYDGALYVMRLDGSGLRKVVPRPSAEPSWQPLRQRGR